MNRPEGSEIMKNRMKRQKEWFLLAAKAINEPCTSKQLHDWCHDNIRNYHRWRCTPCQTGNILNQMPEFKVLDSYRKGSYKDGSNPFPSLTVWMLTRGYFDWYQKAEEE